MLTKSSGLSCINYHKKLSEFKKKLKEFSCIIDINSSQKFISSFSGGFILTKHYLFVYTYLLAYIYLVGFLIK